MDYSKIKQLIDRYWDENTSIEEEREIKMFFSTHSDLPGELEKWRSWFSCLSDISNAKLGNEFDIKILEHIEQKPARNKKRFTVNFRNLAAACIALMIFSAATWKIISYLSEKQHQRALLQANDGYEQIKNMLYFTSSKINETENIVQENISKIDIINEIIIIK